MCETLAALAPLPASHGKGTCVDVQYFTVAPPVGSLRMWLAPRSPYRAPRPLSFCIFMIRSIDDAKSNMAFRLCFW